jgi:hypothetical protein
VRWYWILLIGLGAFAVLVFFVGWGITGLDQSQSRGAQRRKL